MINIESGTLIKVLSCLLSLLNSEERVIFWHDEQSFYLVSKEKKFYAKIAITAHQESKQYETNAGSFESLSKLSKSVAAETVDIELGSSSIFSSNIQFEVPCELADNLPEFNVSIPEEVEYTEPTLLKTLALALSKSSKDNNKGSFGFDNEAIYLPGSHQFSFLRAEGVESSDKLISLTHTQLNKIIRLGKDLVLTSQGEIILKEEDLVIFIDLPKTSINKKTSLVFNKLKDNDKKYIGSSLPKITITEPKKFKDFFKAAKATDRQYDLCELVVDKERQRLEISFFVDKKKSNLFVFTDVKVDNSFSIYLQSKQVFSIAEMSKEQIEIIFSSFFEPLKVIIDESIVTFLMPAYVN